MKKFFLGLFLSFSLFGNQSEKWDAFYFKFIDNPKNKTFNIYSMTLKTISSFSALTLSSLLCNKVNNSYENTIDTFLINNVIDNFENINKIKSSAKFFFILGSGISGYKLSNNYLLNKYEIEALDNVINNWDFYKSKSPTNLVNLLENTKKNYEKLNHENKQEVVYAIKKQIMDYQKTNKKTWSDFFSFKSFNTNLSAEIGSVINGISNLIKSLKK